jgi:hypothetical protein
VFLFKTESKEEFDKDFKIKKLKKKSIDHFSTIQQDETDSEYEKKKNMLIKNWIKKNI